MESAFAIQVDVISSAAPSAVAAGAVVAHGFAQVEYAFAGRAGHHLRHSTDEVGVLFHLSRIEHIGCYDIAYPTFVYECGHDSGDEMVSSGKNVVDDEVKRGARKRNPTSKHSKRKKVKTGMTCVEAAARTLAMDTVADHVNLLQDCTMADDDMQIVIDASTHHANHAITSEEAEDVRAKQRCVISNIKKAAAAGGDAEHNMTANSTAETREMGPKEHYRGLARFLTRPAHSTQATSQVRLQAAKSNSVTIVTREWEERFLREPENGERACANSVTGNCFASQIVHESLRNCKLSLCEFYVPEEWERIKSTGWKWPEVTSPCLLCVRAAAHSKWMGVRCGATGCLASVSHCPIGNITGESGEYPLEMCFSSSSDRYEGILHPVVIPMVHGYGVTTRRGIVHLTQLIPKAENVRPFFF